MGSAKLRIAILYHKNVSEVRSQNYVIAQLADCWREDGHQVISIFGVSEFVPADLIIVHVDLSVVPSEYLEFAARYPICLNRSISDIRKSTFSTGILRRDDRYDGPVILKSDLNYGGGPEKMIFGGTPYFKNPGDYKVYDSLAQLPTECFEREDLIVEKFIPEIDDGLYCVRNFHFLGDRTFCMLWRAKQAIVNGSSRVSGERVEPHPEMVARRKALQFDYGKFDYVVVDGRPILLDMNKTTGGRTMSPEMKPLKRFRAEGLYSYFR